MRKRIFAIFLCVAMIVSFIPSSARAASDSVSERIETLYDLLGGRYFNVQQNTACGVKSRRHGCSSCDTMNIIKSTWFVNEFGNVSTAQFPSSGQSCVGFAWFAVWYIFRESDSDTVDRKAVGSISFNYDTLSTTAQIGDYLYLNGHAAIYLGCDKFGVQVLDCNWSGTDSNGKAYYNCAVQKHTIPYSYSSTIYVARPYSISKERCDHKTEDNAYEIDGRCSSCGAWNTITSTDVETGCYKVVADKTAYLRVHPYKVSNESIGELLASIPSGTEVEVTGAVINCFNNTWYKVKYDGKEGYIVSSSLEWVKDIVHEHTKGEFQFGEAVHPHYKYWKCTGCGELFTDGTTMTSSGCTQCYPPVETHYLDVNGYFDSAYTSAVDEYGTFDVYINGELVADDSSDYFAAWPAGTSYEIKDVRPREGYSYDGVYIGTDGIHDGFRSGTITSKDSVVALSFSKIDAETIGEPAAQMVFNGHTYLYYDTPVTWYTARQLCEAAGGHLVTVTDEAEQTAIMSMGWHGCVWLGASDGNQEGVWQWVTGEVFQYANWLSGQPDDYQGNATAGEDYLTVWEEGVWNDDCGCSKFGFLCEIDSVSHHHELEYIPGMEPTCTEQGQAEAWYCGGCETYFLDSEAQWETTVDELRIAAVGHTVVDGRCENCLECMSAIQNVRWLDGETTVLVDFEYPTPGAQAVCAIYQDGRMIDVIVIPVTESRKTLQFSFGYVECDSIRVLFVDSAFAPLCQSVYETE